jgi:hypothetical protein
VAEKMPDEVKMAAGVMPKDITPAAATLPANTPDNFAPDAISRS